MTFDEAVTNAARTLDAAEQEHAPDRAGTLLTVGNTWVRIAELIHHRAADKPEQ